MKTLDTLVSDVYALFDPDKAHVVNEENLTWFTNTLSAIIRTRLSERDESGGGLRFSGLGKPDRQVWYENHPDGSKEQMSSKTYFKFLYGDVIEALLLFLVKEAGHTVENEQGTVETDGVLGHIDAIVDGVVVDVKSASSFGFKKFKQGSVFDDDPFGYVQQLSGYANVLTPGEGAAWLAMDKTTADLVVAPLSASIVREYLPAPRIAHLRQVIASDTPPERCYSDVPDGKSGNMKLSTGCSYCAHKFRCWPGLRTFIYSTGPRFLTQVNKLPDVYELPQEAAADDTVEIND